MLYTFKVKNKIKLAAFLFVLLILIIIRIISIYSGPLYSGFGELFYQNIIFIAVKSLIMFSIALEFVHVFLFTQKNSDLEKYKFLISSIVVINILLIIGLMYPVIDFLTNIHENPPMTDNPYAVLIIYRMLELIFVLLPSVLSLVVFPIIGKLKEIDNTVTR